MLQRIFRPRLLLLLGAATLLLHIFGPPPPLRRPAGARSVAISGARRPLRRGAAGAAAENPVRATASAPAVAQRAATAPLPSESALSGATFAAAAAAAASPPPCVLRYIRVTNEPAGDFVHLNEIVALDTTGKNVALGAPCSASSEYKDCEGGGCGCANAVDGVRSRPGLAGIFHSAGRQLGEYIEIDLGGGSTGPPVAINLARV